VSEKLEGGPENPTSLGNRAPLLRIVKGLVGPGASPATNRCKADVPLFREGGSRQLERCHQGMNLKGNESAKDKKIEQVRVVRNDLHRGT